MRRTWGGILREHAECGSWMIDFSVAMLVVAIVIAVRHILKGRSAKRRVTANVVVAILDVAVGISSMVTVYRVGDSGAQSVWGDQIARLKKANGG